MVRASPEVASGRQPLRGWRFFFLRQRTARNRRRGSQPGDRRQPSPTRRRSGVRQLCVKGLRIRGRPSAEGCAVNRHSERACFYDHKSAGGILSWSGQVIALHGEEGGVKREKRSGSQRGAIGEWSERSRKRLVLTVLASEAASWGQHGDSTAVLLITLTYPGHEGRDSIPRDGRVAHWDLQRFLKAWTRAYGEPRGVWKLEF